MAFHELDAGNYQCQYEYCGGQETHPEVNRLQRMCQPDMKKYKS